MRSSVLLALTPWCMSLLRAQAPASARDLASTAASWDVNAEHWSQHDTTVFGLGTEGTRVVTWRPDDGSLAKVLVQSRGEAGRSLESYYLASGIGLFLAVRRLESYDQPLGGHVVSARVDSLYYRNGQLVRGVRIDSSATATRVIPLRMSKDRVLARMRATLDAAGVTPN